MDGGRLWRHLLATQRGAHRLFSEQTLGRLQDIVRDGEAGHRGEVRLIVESALPFRKVWRGMTTRQRALDLFGTFRVWDTEENNGVLLYINIADRKLEVIADRAASRAIGGPHWQTVCDLALDAFRVGDFERGVSEALTAIHEALASAYPSSGHAHANQLPDRPVLL